MLVDPHWLFSELDLKYISDSTSNFKEPIGIHIYGRAGFNEDFREEVEIWKRIKWNRTESNDLHNLTKGLETEEQYYLAIREWLNAHPQLVNSWLGK